MARVKLTALDRYQSIYETTVEVTDLNYGNHLGNDALVGIIHRARVHLLHQLSASEHDLGDGKTGILMADLIVNYIGESYLFDKLSVESSIGEVRSKGFRMFHRIKTPQGRIIALAETGIVAFNYPKKKITRIPESFVSKISEL